MSNNDTPDDTRSAILDAIHAKRASRSKGIEDIEALEASLIADIEAFDLDAAERRARREQMASSAAGMSDPSLIFPEIVPSGTQRTEAVAREGTLRRGDLKLDGSDLLSQLRRQAEIRQRADHAALAERTLVNERIDQSLKKAFFFLHDLVQQLNIVNPGIPRDFVLAEGLVIGQLKWHEGFADYRTQSQSTGALVELVSFTYRLEGGQILREEKIGTAAVDRFRSLLFDYGLPFNCKEYKNERGYIERAEFEVRGEISVSARWRADFKHGMVRLETRNLERLGSNQIDIHPNALDQELLDEFGRLVLGQPNRFRELARRQ